MSGLNLERMSVLLLLPPVVPELGAPQHIPSLHCDTTGMAGSCNGFEELLLLRRPRISKLAAHCPVKVAVAVE